MRANTRLDRSVAITALAPHIATDPDLRARVEREARAVAALDHPHVCGIYDVGEASGTHFIVMPYLEGQTLAARLDLERDMKNRRRDSSLQPLTPAALDRIVSVCLAKDPEDRWQSARDLRTELRWVAQAPSAPAAASRKNREWLA